MTTSNTNLRITELDYDQIRENLKDYLAGQAEFTDYDFEGAGMSVLLDILAYNTHYMGFYGNMIANEAFGDTAQVRASILSHAKHMNYVPGSQVGALALVDIAVTPGGAEDQASNTATLSKFTKFLSSAKDGTNYQFVTIHSNTATKNVTSGSFEFSNVWLKQGEVVTKQYLMDVVGNPDRRFTIQSSNVDTSTITVSVQQSTTNTAKSIYTQAQDITEVTANSRVFWIEENSDANGQYTIYFGDDYIGKKPANGSVAIVTYLDVAGEAGNSLDRFVATDAVDGFNANIAVSTITKSASGASRETIEEIRKRAPIHYTSQNRAVTDEDFQLLMLRDYPNLDAVSVWSGAENVPPVYGKVFLSLKPTDNYEITAVEKDRIKNEIIANRSIMTVIPEIVDPIYTYLLLNVHVSYDPKKTTLTSNELSQLVRQTIIDYRDSELKTFESVFRESALHRLIADSEASIISSEITIYLQRRVEFTLDETLTYEIQFYQALDKLSFPDQAYSYPSFTVTDLAGVERKVFYEVTPDSFTGIDSITVVDTGQDYTEIPTVTISGDGSGATATAVVVNRKVESITLNERGSNYSRVTVSITGGGDGSGATATGVLGGDTGVLRTFYYKENGEKEIINENAGTIRFDTGVVTFSEVLPLAVTDNIQYSTNIITFNIQPDEETVRTVRNNIIDIDVNDPKSITIEMLAENI